MVNEEAAEQQDIRMGIEPVKKEKKSLPKFTCRCRRSRFDDLEITVFIPRKYAEKVLSKKAVETATP